MNVEININDYISEEEKKEIVTELFKENVRKIFSVEQEIERVITNFGYNLYGKILNENVQDFESKITQKVIDCIESETPWGLFRKKDVWHTEESKAYTYLQNAVEENKDLINERVKQIFTNISDDYLYNEIKDLITEHIEKMLYAKNK